jgi:Bax protein
MVEALTGGRLTAIRIPGSRKAWMMGFGLLAMLSTAVFVAPVQGPVSVMLRHAAVLGMRKPTTILAFASPSKLQAHFKSIGYDIEAVREGKTGVPRVLLAKVPDGLADMKQAQRRKRVFISLMLPLVLEANERVLRVRARVLLYQAKTAAGKALSKTQAKDLAWIAASYEVSPDRFDLLLSRVDAVPPSLALAQAAIESGWGTSRFVREGNAPFGQWTTSDQQGIVPAGREEGKTHKVRSFDRLIDSVHAYLQNLNTHRAYREFRERRSAMRASARPLDGFGLVPGLSAYSEQKEQYLTLLRRVIEANDLRSLDDARFGDRALLRGSGA